MSTAAHKLLIAHAGQAARQQLAAQFDLDGYEVHEAPTSGSAMASLPRVAPRLLLLGVLERPAAAVWVLRELRAGHIDRVDANLPVVTLGGVDAVAELRAYESGSDHHRSLDAPYVLLRAVIAAVIRRATGPATSPRLLQLGSLVVDVASREVSIDGEGVQLPAREFELLRTLAADPTRVFTKEELLKRVWGYEDPRSTRTLDSHACRLRRHLADGGQPGLVRAVWGVGYRLTS